MHTIDIIIEETIQPITLEVYDGVPGDSAYIVAVKNGFEGTQTEWLDSLQGPQGEQGEQGEQGDIGPQGPQGPSGAGSSWGGIAGNISDQTDLQNEFNTKVDKVTGYSLTKNDLTDALKTIYDNVVSGYNSLIATGVRLITSSEISKLSNTSGTNTGDETNTSIITKIGFTPENSANKGINNGYAGLDSTGKVPSSQLPSFVDDVLEFANYASLPTTGESGKIYITLDTNLEYRWSGTIYVNIAKGDVQSVNTKTGAVVLNTDDISESTTPINKWWTNTRTIGGLLTGFTSGAGTVTSSDSILTAFQKIVGNLSGKEDTTNKSTDVDVDKTSNLKYSTPKSIYDWATALFATKSMSAYSFRVNNTNTTANSTETTYRSQTKQSLSTGITWSGTTAPTGLSGSYEWVQIGNIVNYNITLFYTNAGTLLTQVTITLPSDMPTPLKPDGLTNASDELYTATGRLGSTSLLASVINTSAGLRSNSANNGFEFVIIQGAGAFKVAKITGQYYTA